MFFDYIGKIHTKIYKNKIIPKINFVKKVFTIFKFSENFFLYETFDECDKLKVFSNEIEN
jgi:hypothetical protein